VDDRVKAEALSATVYPNPASSQVVVRFTIEKSSRVSLSLYNMNGQQIGYLLDGNLMAGTHEIQFNKNDLSGKVVPQGVYFFKLQVGEKLSILKVVLTD
jgi:hypothetical protein